MSQALASPQPRISFSFKQPIAFLKVLFRNVGTLLLLLLLLPFNISMILSSIVVSTLYPSTTRRSPEIEQSINAESEVAESEVKRVLITGAKMTKALQLARSFYQDGHEVYLVETHKYWLTGHRFSNAVKQFFTVPVPEEDSDGYCQALVDIAKAHDIDLFVPVSSPI